ncbi:hypothetical protein ACVW0P_001807 [Mucilaginibacter sp. UYNi724]
MNLERYDYFTNDYQAYKFYSEGPKGRIRELVIFLKIPDTEPPIYTLAFGDAHTVTGVLDDAANSNNQTGILSWRPLPIPSIMMHFG